MCLESSEPDGPRTQHSLEDALEPCQPEQRGSISLEDMVRLLGSLLRHSPICPALAGAGLVVRGVKGANVPTSLGPQGWR